MEVFDKDLSPEKYKEYFGIESGKINPPETNSKQKEALDRAWKTRSYEIDKFWQRSKFFWSFIGLVFGAFGAIKTKQINLCDFLPYIDLYLILLGGIVSVAWLLVIRASKCWQENWEHHIDCLEDEITGPLYKTVFCKQKQFYSVSKINEILAWTAIVIWSLLLVIFFTSSDLIQEILELFKPYLGQIFGIIVPLVLTAFCIIRMLTYGRSAGIRKADKTKYPNGAFFGKKSMVDNAPDNK
jgi:hypothetical protein